MMADYQGERYLVAMLGEATNWVSNVRAAGGLAVLRHRRREAVRIEEVDPRVCAPILRRYLQVAPGFRHDWARMIVRYNHLGPQFTVGVAFAPLNAPYLPSRCGSSPRT